MRNTRVYYILPIALIVFILLFRGISSLRSKAPDRNDSFSRNDKVMYGSYILYDRLEDIFPESHIKDVKQTAFQQIYEIYNSYNDDDTLGYINYIFINNNLQEININDVEELLYFVSIGHNVFMSSRIFPDDLVDSLKFSAETNFLPYSITYPDNDDTTNNSEGSTLFMKANLLDYFSSYDSLTTEILGYNEKNQPNLMKVAYGEGNFILSTTPNIFTNYHILKPKNQKFIEEALAYLPTANHIWWDEFYKVRFQQQRKLEESPLQYVYSQESLNWAFWIILIGIIIYVIFEAKRNQRIIPIIKPLPNATLEFTETIGRLYFESRDHQNIAEKKIKILLAYVRRKYHLKTHLFTDDFMKSLAAKSGVEEKEIIELCRMIDSFRRRPEISEDALIALSAKIEAFYADSKR